jgi:hypothetical protein
VLLAVFYFTVLAADRYVSESIVTVRQANQDAAALPGTALLLAGITPPAREDNLYLRQYIHSLDLLKKLDAELNLRAHFEAENLDPFYRLWGGTSQEWFLEYYRARVEVLFDEIAGLLTVRVQGFEPEFAQKLNAAILRDSEAFVNAYSQRMAREQMQFAEGELDRAAQRLQAAKTEVLAFQTKYKLLDPTAEGQAGNRAARPAQLPERRLLPGAGPAQPGGCHPQAARSRTLTCDERPARRAPERTGRPLPGPAVARRLCGRHLQAGPGRCRECPHRRLAQGQEPGGDRVTPPARRGHLSAAPLQPHHAVHRVLPALRRDPPDRRDGPRTPRLKP